MTDSTISNLAVSIDSRVAIIRISRPPANALNAELVTQLRQHLLEAFADKGIGALVITGSGGRFVSGGDVRSMSSMRKAEFREFIGAIQRTFDDLEAAPIPTIAAINGHALGGGLELALACDLRVASRGVNLGFPEVRLGLLPGGGGTQRLVEIVGRGRALEMLLTGSALSADAALEIGLLNRVVSEKDLLPEVCAVAGQLAAGAHHAQAAIKSCVVARIDGGRRAGSRVEYTGVVKLFESSDAREGMAAFLEKRSPKFG